MLVYLSMIVGLVLRIMRFWLIGRVLWSPFRLDGIGRIWGPRLKILRHVRPRALLAQGAPLDYQRSIRGDGVAIFIF
jgi:hypothetical protein